MKSMKVKFVVLLLLAGVLSACASPATSSPASQPTQAPALATDAPATVLPAATDTSAPAAESSPTAGSAAGGAAAVSFSSDILPMLQSRCVNCHGGQRTEHQLNLNSYDGVMAGSENGPVVTPGDAANSPMAEMVANGKMPKRGPKLTPDQVQLIVDWINQGAQNN
jgi:mono/diheme cytochrome c family protein